MKMACGGAAEIASGHTDSGCPDIGLKVAFAALPLRLPAQFHAAVASRLYSPLNQPRKIGR